jgi:hypothetical protein
MVFDSARTAGDDEPSGDSVDAGLTATSTGTASTSSVSASTVSSSDGWPSAEVTLDDGCGPCCPVEILFVTTPAGSRPAEEVGEPIADGYSAWRECIGFVADSEDWSAELRFQLGADGRARGVRVTVAPPKVAACLGRAVTKMRWAPRAGTPVQVRASYRRMAAFGRPPP